MKAILLEELIDNTDAETSQIGGDNLADRTGTHALTVVKNDQDIQSLGGVITFHDLNLFSKVIERRESVHVEKKELEALLGHAQDESPEESHIEDFGETTRIPLTQGQVALVDAADLPLLAPYRWTAIRSGHTWYAKAHVGNRTIYMHRLIVFGDDADNVPFKVDHTNRNGLDIAVQYVEVLVIPLSPDQNDNASQTRGKQQDGSGFGRRRAWGEGTDNIASIIDAVRVRARCTRKIHCDESTVDIQKPVLGIARNVSSNNLSSIVNGGRCGVGHAKYIYSGEVCPGL